MRKPPAAEQEAAEEGERDERRKSHDITWKATGGERKRKEKRRKEREIV